MEGVGIAAQEAGHTTRIIAALAVLALLFVSAAMLPVSAQSTVTEIEQEDVSEPVQDPEGSGSAEELTAEDPQELEPEVSEETAESTSGSAQKLSTRDALPEAATDLQLDESFKTNLFTGAFIYTYTIQVPPGTNGLQPGLGLFYVSQKTTAPPTVLGSGWDITQSYIQRDVNSTVANLSDDFFTLLLDGTAYDLVYVPQENRYHTKTESFLYIRNEFTSTNEKGQYWVIKQKDGTTYRLGYLNESEVPSAQGNTTWRWYLDLVTDISNNSIFYAYRENPYPNESNATYLDTIRYNNDQRRQIRLLYENAERPDGWEGYLNGNLVRYTRKLAAIETVADDSLVRKYSFNYLTLDNGSRSFLANITIIGNDGESELPPTIFTYNSINEGWTTSPDWSFPTCFINENADDRGVRLADVNGDGLTDILTGRNSDKTAHINNGSSWVEDLSWSPPVFFIGSNAMDRGVRLADVNGDGLTDILTGRNSDNPTIGCSDSQRTAYINTGSSWVENETWRPPYPFCFAEDDDGLDRGARIVDVNGDGLVDLLIAGSHLTGCSQSVNRAFINNGNGWTEDPTWSPPLCFITASNGADQGTRIADVNGDGLPDLLRGVVDPIRGCADDQRVAFLNNGSGWIEDSSWKVPEPFCFVGDGGIDRGVRIVDVNGDGLSDLLKSKSDGRVCDGTNRLSYINNGSSWVEDPSWKPLSIAECFAGELGIDQGNHIADVNSDGLPDIVQARFDGRNGCRIEKNNVVLNNGNQNHLLSSVKNSLGGSLSIDYTPSTSFDNTGTDEAGDLGFPLWVVSSVTQSNGMAAGANSTSHYNYSGGLYDHKGRDFRGFAQTTEVLPDSTTVLHFFHQDAARAGREYRTDILDGQGRLYQRSTLTWNVTTINESNRSYHITDLIKETASIFDGEETDPVVTETTYRTDSFGNTIEIASLGDVRKTGDERYEQYEFAPNAAVWIVDKPGRSLLLNADRAVVREAFYSYDYLPQGTPPSRGLLTREEQSLDTGPNPVTTAEYDSYGNLITLTGPLGHTTRYVYGVVDTTFTFPDQEINHLGHTARYTYDLGTGRPLTITDPNNAVITYTYDVLGRISTEILPLDSADYPTKQYVYELAGTAPNKVTILQRESAGTSGTFDIIQFTDGFGSRILEKQEAENARQIRIDTFYDQRIRVDRRSNPYLSATQQAYTSPDETMNKTNFTYDPLDRVTAITNPDGTVKTFRYDHQNVTLTDENGNQMTQILDAYGQITDVFEFNNDEVYHTTYEYDAAGNLVAITDNEGNLFTFAYDALGRKTSMTDPDLGTWTYEYDAAGNLIRQTDNRGTVTTFGYDELNRITRKVSSGETISYVYDEDRKGTLSRIETPGVVTTFQYDDRLRVTEETTTIDGEPFTIMYTYDSLNRETGRTAADGRLITYSYTPQNQLGAIADIITATAHNELGMALTRTYANALQTVFTYDPENLRIAGIRTGTFQDLNYTYDNASNILRIDDPLHSRTSSMLYDPLNRLIFAERTDSGSLTYLFRYSYSSLGSILNVSTAGENITYTYSSWPAHAPVSIYRVANNTPPTSPTSLACNSGSCTTAFSRSVDLACAGSSDPDNDLLTYAIDAYYSDTGDPDKLRWNQSFPFCLPVSLNASGPLPRTNEPVELFLDSSVWEHPPANNSFRLFTAGCGEGGTEAPFQILNATYYRSYYNSTVLFFLANHTGPSDTIWSLYYSDISQGEPRYPSTNLIQAGSCTSANCFIENNYIRAGVDYNGGVITDLFYKPYSAATDLIAWNWLDNGSLGLLHNQTDLPHVFSHLTTDAACELTRNGSLMAEVTCAKNNNASWQRFRLYAGHPFIDIRSHHSAGGNWGSALNFYAGGATEPSDVYYAYADNTTVTNHTASGPWRSFGTPEITRISFSKPETNFSSTDAVGITYSSTTRHELGFADNAGQPGFGSAWYPWRSLPLTSGDTIDWRIAFTEGPVPEVIGQAGIDVSDRHLNPLTATAGEELMLNRSAWQSLGNHTGSQAFRWDIAGVPPQSNIDLRCRAIDYNGTRSYSGYFTPFINLTVLSPPPDAEPPVVVIHSPANVTYTSPTLPLDVSASEGIDSWWYSLNSGPNSTFTPNTTIAGREGSNSLLVFANDSAGNIGSSAVSFTVDTVSPRCGTTINSSLTLSRNFTAQGTCFTLGAHNIVIDGAGYTITGNGSGYGIDNSGGYDNIIIKNFGGINNFTRGISAAGTADSIIVNNTIEAANVIGGYGVYLIPSSRNNSILSNTIRTFGLSAWGIHLSSVSGSMISGNIMTTSGTNGYGIYLSSPTTSTISSNTITTSGSYAYGIYLSSSTSSNTFLSNTITTSGPSAYGTYFSSGSNNTFINDTILATNANDVMVYNGEGAFINATFTKNDIGFVSGAVGNLTVQWYADVAVQNTSGTLLENANVTIYNTSGAPVFSGLTDATGHIPQQTLTEFWQNRTEKTYSTPHTIISAAPGYPDNITTLNVTTTGSTSLVIVLEEEPVIIDTVPPVVTMHSPENKTYSSSIIGLNYSVADNISGIGSCWYQLDDTDNQTLPSCANITLSLSDGLHSVAVYANDTAGNIGSSGVSFTVDTTAPAITLSSPQNTTYNITAITLSASADEPITTWRYALNSGPETVFTPGDTIVASEGSNAIVVTAIDLAGNEQSTTIHFTVDLTPPAITIDYPENETYTAAVMDLLVSADEPIDQWQYSLNGLSNVTFIPNATITGREGRNTLTVYATDRADHESSTTVSFTIELFHPDPRRELPKDRLNPPGVPPTIEPTI